MWDFLQTVQRSDVIQCIYGRRQASVKAENLQDEETISINLDVSGSSAPAFNSIRSLSPGSRPAR